MVTIINDFTNDDRAQSMFIMDKNMFLFFISDPQVGHKLGEFVPTRTFRSHKKKLIKKKDKLWRIISKLYQQLLDTIAPSKLM
jgi:hypothetical protein